MLDSRKSDIRSDEDIAQDCHDEEVREELARLKKWRAEQYAISLAAAHSKYTLLKEIGIEISDALRRLQARRFGGGRLLYVATGYRPKHRWYGAPYDELAGEKLICWRLTTPDIVLTSQGSIASRLIKTGVFGETLLDRRVHPYPAMYWTLTQERELPILFDPVQLESLLDSLTQL